MSYVIENELKEEKRMAALKRFDILDSPPDGNFDRITRLASIIFEVPIAIISLVDTDRIWFKSHHGLAVTQIGRDPGLCASAILGDDVYVVEDARRDPRTLANPLVASEFGLQFYAGVPLHTDDHFNLGTLCVIDKQPRSFTQKEKLIMEQLGKLVMDEMHKRVQLRNAVHHIRHLAGDVELQLDDTIKGLTSGKDGEKDKILSYLEASRLYLSQMKEQLGELE